MCIVLFVLRLLLFFLAVLHVVSAVAGRIDQWADRSKENYSFGQAARAILMSVRGEILIISAYPAGLKLFLV